MRRSTQVYSARTPEELSAAYADWAATYDGETAVTGLPACRS